MGRRTPSLSGWGIAYRPLRWAVGVSWGMLNLAGWVHGDERQATEFFEKRIRPVLVQFCYECHSASLSEPKGGLRLDSRAFLRSGGDSGPAIVPGNADASLLMEALRYEGLEMPPKQALPSEVIADFERWIETGAADPRGEPDAEGAEEAWAEVLQSRLDWWSLKTPEPLLPPAPTDHRSRGAIDDFISAHRLELGVRPSLPAEPALWLRRASFVLTGLPPAPDELDAFLARVESDGDLAYPRAVDRLLASPTFGERWARHWMDIVRFTETHGNEWNYEVHHAWRYRDYLIRAFNGDVPYDQFVREHIAGDLLDPARWNHQLQLNESAIGTAFYRFGEVNHDDCVTLPTIGYDILDNQIDTLSKAFQATTIACARCHHHKIDAVSMDDYYALLGILKSSRMSALTLDAETVNADQLDRLQELQRQIKEVVVDDWRRQLEHWPNYLLAADGRRRQVEQLDKLTRELSPERLDHWEHVLQVNPSGMEHPLWIWRQASEAESFEAAWPAIARQLHAHAESQAGIRQERYSNWADFGDPEQSLFDQQEWFAAGQGLRETYSRAGEPIIAVEGNTALGAILPAGVFTHRLSTKLNGTLRSQPLPTSSQYVSARVLGGKTSAFRLVSNNCQLNYANYRALTSPQLQWVTFKIPAAADRLSTFAELVTKLDNPKFPDQLGTLGGDLTNDRIPLETALADPRSYFGITQVVLHDVPDAPPADLKPVMRLVEMAEGLANLSDLAERYQGVLQVALAAWESGVCTDEDVYWLDWAARENLLDHSLDRNATLHALVTEYRQVEQQLQIPRLAAGLADAGVGSDHVLFERGDIAQPGRVVPRTALQLLATGESSATAWQGSGRMQLARAIASADNPLTARVMVNRLWQHVFGTGLVRTVDDFGRVGELPTHPQLLDYLAVHFSTPVSSGGLGWSMKAMIREMVLSDTFRLSNRPHEQSLASDPQNRSWHYYPARRLEAEAIRDCVLSAAGNLRQEMFGMSVQPYREQTNADRRLFAGPLDGEGRRSLYIKRNLMEGPRFLSAFNIPGGKVVQGRRDTTNVPSQALAMLNDAFVLSQSQAWAERLAAEKGHRSVERRIEQMWLQAVGRRATVDERRQLTQLVETLRIANDVHEGQELASAAIWRDVAHLLFNLQEFIYIP